MPSIKRFYADGYVARLQQRGYEIIGRGGMDALGNDASLVLAKPGERVVVKVGMEPYADPWPMYAAWCLRHPGPFRPTVRSLRWHGDARAIALSRDAGRVGHAGRPGGRPYLVSLRHALGLGGTRRGQRTFRLMTLPTSAPRMPKVSQPNSGIAVPRSARPMPPTFRPSREPPRPKPDVTRRS